LKTAIGRLPNWLNAVANKSDYIARVQVAIMQLHNCSATWRESMPVREVFQGKTIWQGNVEVFDLEGHPKAKRAYGWSHPEKADGTGERFVAVLEIPPVVSPETAVKVSIVSDLKSARNIPKQKL
jgi:hypothetical protein